MSAHSRIRGAALAAATIALIALGSPVSAATPTTGTTPGKATRLRAATTTSSATLTWSAGRNARSYSVCLYTSGTSRSCRRFAHLTTRSLTIRNLKPTGGTDYFFTVTSYNGSRLATTARVGFNLKPFTLRRPANLRAYPAPTSVILNWSAVANARTYDVCLYTSGTATRCVRSYRGLTEPTITVAGLKPTGGTDYYFTVTARNGSTAAGTGRVAFNLATRTPVTAAFDASVLTFNLCGEDRCLTKANGMSTWPIRRPLAGALARSTGADIIATQESALKTNFGSELPGFARGCYKSAKSLYYRTAKYSLIRAGWNTLDFTTNRFTCWVELQDKASHTRFMVADAHLEPYKGLAKDNLRNRQTQYLLRAMTKANPELLPVVFAGDFNSNRSNANQDKYPGGYDAPLQVMNAAGMLDALHTADLPTNTDYNSANQAVNPPKRGGYQIDSIFVDPGIHVTAAGVVLALTPDLSAYTTPFASDHNPLQAALTIPGNR